jgi:hypothetical protein
MPWGKFKGIYLKDVPTDYIKWAVTNYKDNALATWFAEELQHREPIYRKPIK